MEQHPVPQNVTTFQFRLIGDMTIKQFGYLCAGAILAFIAYKLPLPLIVTWPLAGALAFLGVGFAFIPVEERPMDVWVFSFFRSIYSPTQYIWSNTQKAPTTKPPTPAPASSPLKQQVVVPPSPKSVLSGLFQHVPTPKPVPASQSQQFPTDHATQEKISKLEEALHTLESQLSLKTATADRVLELQKQLTDVMRQKNHTDEELLTLKRTLEPVKPPSPPEVTRGVVNVISTQEAAVKVGLPRLTNSPNVITGIVKDDEGNFLPGILVTVTNQEGVPVRALKTNKLGQFAASTPLTNGIYFVEVEDPRQRFTFSRVQLTLNGGVVPVIEIIAKSEKALTRERLAQELFGKPL